MAESRFGRGENVYLASFPQIVIERTRKIGFRVQNIQLNFRRTTGPDNLSGRVLNVCNVQLCNVFVRIINQLKCHTCPVGHLSGA